MKNDNRCAAGQSKGGFGREQGRPGQQNQPGRGSFGSTTGTKNPNRK